VHAGDDPVEPGEGGGREVERAVRQDVHLDAREQAHAAARPVQLRDPGALRAERLLVEPERARARVVRDREVLAPEAIRLVDQLLERGAAPADASV
jgi:hypothetical protein